MRTRSKVRIAVAYNRDFEGANEDPENRAREDIKDVAERLVEVLEGRGFEVVGVGVTSDVHAAMARLKTIAPAAVFNLCESIQGDNRFEALLPMLLDLERIPYTGSSALALTLALHKHKAKDILRGRGVSTPAGTVVHSVRTDLRGLNLEFPLIVKPTREDASVGISSGSVVHDTEALEERVRHVLAHYHQPVLVEQFVEGREIYVSMLERPNGSPQVFPFFEIDFSDLPTDRPRIVSFEGKWVEDSVEYNGTKPVRCQGLTPAVEARIAQTALATFEALELRDYGRVDVRLASDGTPYVIDVNPNCDLSDLAGGYSRAAKAAGLSYETLISRLIDLALARRSDADSTPLQPRSKRAQGADSAGDPEPLPARGGIVRAGAS